MFNLISRIQFSMPSFQAVARGAKRSKKAEFGVSNTSVKFKKFMRVLLTITALVAVIVGYVWAWPRVNPAVEQVIVEADLKHIKESQIKETIFKHVDGGILSLNIERLRDQVAQMQWTETAAVERVYPSRLVVRLKEKQAAMRWQNWGYVSDKGVLIKSVQFVDLQHLPLLSSEQTNPLQPQKITQLYYQLNTALQQFDLSIVELNLSKSGGLTLYWNNGLSINLGRIDHLNRAKRAIMAWQQLPARNSTDLLHIDARYNNGVVVKNKKVNLSAIENSELNALNLNTIKNTAMIENTQAKTTPFTQKKA